MTRTVLITGTSSGIGLATVRIFYEYGWNVIATMRRPERSPLPPHLDWSRILVCRLDLLDFSTIEPAIVAGIEKFSKIDLVINNAGYGQNGLFEMISKEQIEAAFKVNVFGAMEVTRAIIPHFRAIGGGGIINVSAGAGLYTSPMISVYCSSKFALEGFTESLSYELESQRIFVKLINPHGGVTDTNFNARSMALTPMDGPFGPAYASYIHRTMEAYKKMPPGRSITARDVAQVILMAATDGSDRLRYLVGNDTRGFVQARYESKSDEQYMTHMRKFFR